MIIQKIKISQINPAPYNPRLDLKPGDQEYDQLKASMDTFGCVEPLVWNKRTRTLVSGHQRLKVLVEQGQVEVEVSVVDLSIEKEKALNLALNKIKGDWDNDKLTILLDELSKVPDFDTSLTGFDLGEISGLFDRYKENPDEDDFDVESEVASIEKPITKKGDLILLGSHRLLCGDSASRKEVESLLNGEKINLVFTDPPYGVEYYGGDRPHGKARPKKCKNWDVVYQDNLSQPDYEVMLGSVIDNMDAYLATGSAYYIWNGHKQFGPMHHMLTKRDLHVSCVIVWSKPSFSISYGDYHQQVEFCLYGWKANNGAHYWAGPTNESTLWEIGRDPAKDLIHPTQKPIALAQRAIRNSSKMDDVVVDFFGGSGSTLIAAESLKRRCFLIEAEPKHCDAIVRRYIRYAGAKVSDEVRSRYAKEAIR